MTRLTNLRCVQARQSLGQAKRLESSVVDLHILVGIVSCLDSWFWIRKDVLRRTLVYPPLSNRIFGLCRRFNFEGSCKVFIVSADPLMQH